MADQRQSLLFQVPYDVRAEIYKSLIRGLYSVPYFPGSQPQEIRLIVGLLLMCHRVRDECEPLVYQELESTVARPQNDIIRYTNDTSQRAQHNLDNLRQIMAPGATWWGNSPTWIQDLKTTCAFIMTRHPDLGQVAINLSPHIVDGNFESQVSVQDLPPVKVFFTLTLEIHFYRKVMGHGFSPKRYEIDLLNRVMKHLDTQKTALTHERPHKYIWHEDGPVTKALISLSRDDWDFDSEWAK